MFTCHFQLVEIRYWAGVIGGSLNTELNLNENLLLLTFT